MRKIQYTLCALALAVSAGANAFDGTVNFDGELVTNTCKIQAGDENIDVTLPKINISALDAADKVAGTTPFSIHVEDCPAGVTQVGAHFEANGSTGWDPTTGNLTNAATGTPTPATNVQVRLFNQANNTQIPIGTAGTRFPVDATTKKATLTYVGGYYSTAATTAGPVKASVNYTLEYP
ncbi:F17 fimbrial protein [Enterobacterales bacterium CwR94]|nr:F17 fimbrial protein [Enterobacterales bacterium CwR94]